MVIDETKLLKTKEIIETTGESVFKITDDIVFYYSSDLDRYIVLIREGLENPASFSDEELERLIIRLPELLYWVSAGVEIIGTKEDLCKIKKTEVYNESLKTISQSGVKLTSSEKTSLAQEDCLYEQLILIAYTRAGKQLKSKLDVGMELLQSVKKIISNRMLDKEVNKNYKSTYISPK